MHMKCKYTLLYAISALQHGTHSIVSFHYKLLVVAPHKHTLAQSLLPAIMSHHFIYTRRPNGASCAVFVIVYK